MQARMQIDKMYIYICLPSYPSIYLSIYIQLFIYIHLYIHIYHLYV